MKLKAQSSVSHNNFVSPEKNAWERGLEVNKMDFNVVVKMDRQFILA